MSIILDLFSGIPDDGGKIYDHMMGFFKKWGSLDKVDKLTITDSVRCGLCCQCGVLRTMWIGV